MTIVEPARAVTGGVDTHLDVNVAAALDDIGGLLGDMVAEQRSPTQRPQVARGAALPALVDSGPQARHVTGFFPGAAALPPSPFRLGGVIGSLMARGSTPGAHGPADRPVGPARAWVARAGGDVELDVVQVGGRDEDPGHPTIV